MPTNEQHQRIAARAMLDAIGTDGFALAGSGAIREHGMISRPTEDLDLFTTSVGAEAFAGAVDAGVRALEDAGYSVDEHRRTDQYARLLVTSNDGYSFDVDMGVDWRAHDPVRLEVGPVLALEDAVANKVLAIYGRTEGRDFLDVDAIRSSGRYSDAELVAIAGTHDDGFEQQMFAQQLRRVERITHDQVAQYGVTAAEFATIQRRTLAWASALEAPAAPSTALEARARLVTSYPTNVKDALQNGPQPRSERRRGPRADPGRDSGLER